MTSERVQRVSDFELGAEHLDPWAEMSDVMASDGLRLARDLRDARAERDRLTAENADLRGALATARRDAIEEAVQATRRLCHEWTDNEENDRKMIGDVQGFVIDAGVAIRALAPDTAEGEGDG